MPQGLTRRAGERKAAVARVAALTARMAAWLALARDPRDETTMQKGGGIILAISLLVGAGVGVKLGEGSLGIVIGLGVGLLAVVVLGWLDSRRKR
ncbi:MULTISPECIES: hypothetical protein [Sphingosinicellaceae]|uniref:hypothetical protein n=1 Tax=Sphingosinicellaceae TaxID=2820280 RepID=UPI001C1E0DF9|nr:MULTISPECIES: hypothetical protein [Polymorphobacter]QYE36199.1 hypothetical protein KZX46_09835 [Polymorphobacter sp. PAMC 29334]UAJ10228.1 hypothetical protein KTC28_00155 [Polymorphobacter megasporae]